METNIIYNGKTITYVGAETTSSYGQFKFKAIIDGKLLTVTNNNSRLYDDMRCEEMERNEGAEQTIAELIVDTYFAD